LKIGRVSKIKKKKIGRVSKEEKKRFAESAKIIEIQIAKK